MPQYEDATLQSAYERGRSAGAALDSGERPRIGEAWGETTPETLSECREIHSAALFEAEDYSRQYSPFECTAAEFNASPDIDMLWDAYDAGVADAIRETVQGCTAQHYGCPDEVFYRDAAREDVSAACHEIRITDDAAVEIDDEGDAWVVARVLVTLARAREM